ncbi:MAG: hypothetical protein HKN12_07105, partial [Gemmatimonadetes bacterium]|nr:hypothetical protein [Gemmatimonadota bacterium]
RTLDGENGFSMGAFRASARGALDGGVSYFVQTSFTGTPALLDARITHRASPGFGVSVGAMKAPFSAEFLTGAADIDFVNRSRGVSALAPGRQLGLMLDGRLGGSPVHYQAGVFNGNGVRANGNDGGVMGAGRLEVRTAGVRAGVSGAVSEDRSVSVGPFSSFNGTRTLFGADVRATHGAWTGSAEVIGAELDPDGGMAEKPWGFHVTGALATSPRVQILARLDALKADDIWTRYGVAGLNFWPTGPTELQFNVLVPLGESTEEPQLLVNAQINL